MWEFLRRSLLTLLIAGLGGGLGILIFKLLGLFDPEGAAPSEPYRFLGFSVRNTSTEDVDDFDLDQIDNEWSGTLGVELAKASSRRGHSYRFSADAVTINEAGAGPKDLAVGSEAFRWKHGLDSGVLSRATHARFTYEYDDGGTNLVAVASVRLENAFQADHGNTTWQGALWFLTGLEFQLSDKHTAGHPVALLPAHWVVDLAVGVADIDASSGAGEKELRFRNLEATGAHVQCHTVAAVASASYTQGGVVSNGGVRNFWVGGQAATFSVSPALPTGLSIRPNDGVIEGTPSVASGATDYTITMTGPHGMKTTVKIRITVT